MNISEIKKENAKYFRGIKAEIVKAGCAPIKAVYDAAGNCFYCGEAGRCPKWHAKQRVTNSWIVRRIDTKSAVAEIYSPELLKKINTNKYEICTPQYHLASLNKEALPPMLTELTIQQ